MVSADRPPPLSPARPAPSPFEGWLQALLPQWPGVFFRQRADLTFELCGGNLAGLTGLPRSRWEVEPDLFWEILHELDADEVRRQLARAGAAEAEAGVSHGFRIRHAATGRVRHVTEFRKGIRDAAGRVTGYDGFWMDVTRQTLAERRLAGAAWKETLGLLTLGLAHDFNNVLAGIQGLSDSFLAQVPPEHPFCEGLALVKRSTQHGAQLIQRIAQLHRFQTGARGYHNLNDLVKQNLDLLRKVLPKTITLAEELAPVPLPLYVDAVELQQVLINLALNAADAMPDRGTLTLRTSQHETDIAPALSPAAGAKPRSPTVCLSVIDTGVGIKPQLMPLLFDPFFTTKPMNRGSGLGLYNARLFVEKHQGGITVESQEGSGATFHVWLPQADFTEADRALQLSRERRRTLLLAGPPGQRLENTARFLRRHQYHVVLAGGDAVDLLRSSDYVFDAVLLLAEGADNDRAAEVIRFVRFQKLPVKIIIETVGRDPDELPAALAAQADLVISAETPAESIPGRLTELFDC